MNQYFKTNQILWDAKTEIHKDSDFYDNENFLKGKTSLKKYELDALGDVAGKSMLHLQCHFGQDSLSWARMGAQVTGVDFSSKAIQLARQMNEQLGLDVRFLESNVLELDQNLEGQFDIVFTSYGVIAWLDDLEQWAKIIHHFLKPGGTFYIVEFHPVIYMFDFDSGKIEYNYFNHGNPYEEVESGTYAAKNSDIRLKEYFWQHSLAEVINSLLGAGLQLVDFQEFTASPYNCFTNMRPDGNGMFLFEIDGNQQVSLPHVFSLKMVPRLPSVARNDTL